MKKILSAVACLTVVFLAATVQAEVIKFTDDKGTVSFVDDLSKVPKKYRKNVIREQQQDAVRVVSEDSPPGQTGSVGGDVVQLCYYRSLSRDEGGQTLLDFLKEERRTYRAMDLYRHPEYIDECVSIYCNYFTNTSIAKAQNTTMELCVRDSSKMFRAGVGLPFIQYRGKYYQNDSNEFILSINKNARWNSAAQW